MRFRDRRPSLTSNAFRHQVAALVLTGSACIIGQARAEPGAQKPVTYTVVTPRREPEPALDVDRSVHLLHRTDLAEQQVSSLPDALQETTGVSVQITNRGAGAPYLRGMVGPQNLILIDGIRFNNSTFRTGPNQYLALIDPSSVDHLELMLGPGSVLYGSDAMGGVIQVFPTAWTGRPGLGATGGARFASADLSPSLWADGLYQGKDLQVLAGGAFRYFHTLTAGEGVEQPLSDYLQGAWRARAAYHTSERSVLGLTYLAARVRNAGREDRLYEGRFRFYDNDDDLLYLDWRYRPGKVLRELRLAASFHRTYEGVNLYRCSLPSHPRRGDADSCIEAGLQARTGGREAVPQSPLTRQEQNRDAVLTPGLLAQASLGFWENRLRLVSGLETYFDLVSSEKDQRRGDRQPSWEWKSLERGNFSDGSTYRSLGGFAHLEGDVYRRGRHRIVAAAGARVSSFAAFAPDVPGLGDVEYDFTGVVGTAGVRYLYRRSLLFYANFSQGFRAPNLQETTVLGDTGSKFEVPNADLSPESSNTFEGGLRVEEWPVRLHLAGYLSLLDDAIDERTLSESEWQSLGVDPASVGDKPVVQRINSEQGRNLGVEATAALGPFYRFTPWVRLAWIRGDIETVSGERSPARRIPPFIGAAGLRYDNAGRPPFYVELSSRFAAAQNRLHPSDMQDLRICEDPDALGDTYADSGQYCPGTPGWWTLNLRGGYVHSRQLRVDAALTNMTDALYHVHGSGVDAPGVGATLSVMGEY